MPLNVPFFRVELTDEEIEAVVATLRSGWLTTGPRTRELEAAFAETVGASHAVALNSCTAALHLATEALGLRAGDVVLVPTLTFAATAEVLRYRGAHPLLVDCDPATGHLCLQDAREKVRALRAGELAADIPRDAPIVGIIPMHYGGLMMDPRSVGELAEELDLWVVEDAAHSFPASVKTGSGWHRCGEGPGVATCFSFYANKTMTTGEGGIAVTNDATLADRMRLLSLHGLSKDAWSRFDSASRAWDYRIIAPGYKYNLTDIAAALGLRQLARSEEMRVGREKRANEYLERLAAVEQLRLPAAPDDVIHSWHLFAIRLEIDRLSIDRDTFIDLLKGAGVGCSVHYRPLHLHPYYRELGWRPEDLPRASDLFRRNISLPLFSSMRDDEMDHVVNTLHRLCASHAT